MATRNIESQFRKLFEQERECVIPPNRYLRTNDSPTQVAVITPTKEDNDDSLGMGILLNHLRIPYRWLTIDNATYVKADLILACGVSPSQLPPNLLGIAIPVNEPARFLPFRDGLRSKLTIRLISQILSHLRAPLITGMMPARVSLRVDDVAGRSIEHYLPPALAHGWRPNLGIFVSDFYDNNAPKARWLSHWGSEGAIDFSPHAFSPTEFIYFDYSRGLPYCEADFRARWEVVCERFNGWNFPISSVLNTHFHSLSSAALKVLEPTKIQYFFSELALDSVERIPGSTYLPSGDPTLTTGTVGTGPFLQIYSGDSTLDLNQPDSLYDFMMHVNRETTAHDAARRALSRLELTLNTGFASFITSHEYLLSPHLRATHESLWDQVEKELDGLSRWKVRKVSMAELGAICWDHTHTLIEHVRSVANNRWVVRLSGKGNGTCPLMVWCNQRFIEIPVPAFNGTIETEVIIHES